MNTDGNLDALRRYENEQEKNEKETERQIELFRDLMNDSINDLLFEFNKHAKSSYINRNELRNILLEDIGEQL
jgi:hypothetical protein